MVAVAVLAIFLGTLRTWPEPAAVLTFGIVVSLPSISVTHRLVNRARVTDPDWDAWLMLYVSVFFLTSLTITPAILAAIAVVSSFVRMANQVVSTYG
jgi:hypothetical protein